MNPPSNQVDKHGFPLPRKFEDELPPPGAGRRPQGKSPLFRLAIAVLFLGIAVAVIVESPIGAAGRNMWVQYLAERGIEKRDKYGDLPGALADFDRAVAWLAPSVDSRLAAGVYRVRASVRLEDKQLEAAREDADRAIEIEPKDMPGYLLRSLIWQRQGDFRRALDDVNRAFTYRPAHDANIYNTRAYARAMAGVELSEALEDVEKALSFWHGENAAFLDTRGYIHFLQGNLKPALADLDQAIRLAEQDRQREIDQLKANHGISKHLIERIERNHDHNLAVMYHHRGQIYEKLDRAEEAKADLERGDKLGYNPAEGVF
jgi:tetratricopeptide (TPR) repeat protein